MRKYGVARFHAKAFRHAILRRELKTCRLIFIGNKIK